MFISASKLPQGLCVSRIAWVEDLGPHRARLALEPFERGGGTTWGAALRRVLLSSLPGCASTQVAVAGSALVTDVCHHPGDGAAAGPVHRVEADVEPVRVGPRTDLERLVLDIQTDGSVPPLDALHQAARLLQVQLDPLAGPGPVFDTACADALRAPRAQRHPSNGLMRTIDELDLSVRAFNGLKAAQIDRVGDLIQRTEPDLLRTPNLGRRSLNEIKDALAALGFVLGTPVQDWPPSGGGAPH